MLQQRKSWFQVSISNSNFSGSINTSKAFSPTIRKSSSKAKVTRSKPLPFGLALGSPRRTGTSRVRLKNEAKEAEPEKECRRVTRRTSAYQPVQRMILLVGRFIFFSLSLQQNDTTRTIYHKRDTPTRTAVGWSWPSATPFGKNTLVVPSLVRYGRAGMRCRSELPALSSPSATREGSGFDNKHRYSKQQLYLQSFKITGSRETRT